MPATVTRSTFFHITFSAIAGLDLLDSRREKTESQLEVPSCGIE
jgi:hypothetical protein